MTSSSSFSPTLRALCAEATKGPWHLVRIADDASPPTGFSHPGLAVEAPALEGHNIEGRYADDTFICGMWGVVTPEDHASASLIVFLANRAEAIAELAEAAEKMLGMYVAMINSGDCGSWNPEDDAEVKALRAALARLEEGA